MHELWQRLLARMVWYLSGDITTIARLVPLPSSTMTRLSLVALLALASSGFVIATPTAMQEVVVAGNARTTNSWSYTDCGE